MHVGVREVDVKPYSGLIGIPLEPTRSLNTFSKQTLAIVSPSQVGSAERQIRNTRETSLLTRKNGGLQISSVAERS